MNFCSSIITCFIVATAYVSDSGRSIHAFQVVTINQKPLVRSTATSTGSTTITTTTSSTSTKTNLFSMININEDTPRDVMTMFQWAEACGVQTCDGFELICTEDQDDHDTTAVNHRDISVVTTKDLEMNSPILYVPNEMIMSAMKIRNEEMGPLHRVEERLISAKAQEHIPQFYLFIKILQQYVMGTESPWYPWLNSLPRYFSNGASMTNFCFDCLPPLAGYLSQLERIKFGQFIFLLDTCVNDDIIPRFIKNDHDVLKWAFNIVYTRSFQKKNSNSNTGDDYCLTPMADMFNHGTDGEIIIQYDDDGNCYAYAMKDIQAGSPLRYQYADPTNPSHLLARYGFVDKTSPATFCKIMINQPSKEIINMGYDHTKMLFYRNGQVTEEVYDVLLYQYLKRNNEMETLQMFYDAHMNNDTQTKRSIHEHYYEITMNELKKHVNDFLFELDVLQQKGNNQSIVDHPRLPLIQAHNEFVKETFLNVREQLFSI